MYQELHRWEECIAVAEAKVLFVSSRHKCSELGLTNSRIFPRKPWDLE